MNDATRYFELMVTVIGRPGKSTLSEARLPIFLLRSPNSNLTFQLVDDIGMREGTKARNDDRRLNKDGRSESGVCERRLDKPHQVGPSSHSQENLVELANEPLLDFYQVLAVDRNATPIEIKAAYRRALLLFHPDKNNAIQPQESVTISLIKEAYLTLSTPHLKEKYGLDTFKTKTTFSGPRPAQVISLEEFQDEGEDYSWTYACRCGGRYRITGEEMEKGQHLVACNSCSEIIWVGYELQDDVDYQDGSR